jgi:hypothetical protein
LLLFKEKLCYANCFFFIELIAPMKFPWGGARATKCRGLFRFLNQQERKHLENNETFYQRVKMNTRHVKVTAQESGCLVDASDVVAGEGAEEAVSGVGADKPAVVALL